MNSGHHRATPLSLFRDPEFVALVSARFARGISFATIIIALALYADAFSASGAVAGLFGTVYAVVRLVLVLPLGRYIDLGNPKRYLVAGLIANGILFLGFMQVGAIEHVIFLRAVQGGGSALMIIAITSIIGQICPDEERGLWIGTANQVKSVSSLGGDLVGGGLLFLYGFQTTYAVMIALTGIALVAVFVFLRDDPGTRADPKESTGVETLRQLLAQRSIRALVGFRIGFSFGKMAVIIFLPIFARTQFGMNPFMIGAILAGSRITKATTQGRVGALNDRIGHLSWFIAAAAILSATGTVLMPFAGSVSGVIPSATIAGFDRSLTFQPAFFWLFASYMLLGVADSLRNPTSTAMFIKEGEAYDAVAGSVSLRSLSWQVGAIAGPFVVGSVLDYTSFMMAFWLAALVILGAGGVFFLLYSTAAVPGPQPHPDD